MDLRRDSFTRIDRIKQRGAAALLYLTLNGPSKLTSIAAGIGLEVPHARYTMVTLHQDRLAHICEYQRITGEDNIPRQVAFYTTGEGNNVPMPRVNAPDGGGVLDFESTLHLQPIYSAWAATRTPDYEVDDVS